MVFKLSIKLSICTIISEKSSLLPLQDFSSELILLSLIISAFISLINTLISLRKTPYSSVRLYIMYFSEYFAEGSKRLLTLNSSSLKRTSTVALHPEVNFIKSSIIPLRESTFCAT